MDQQKENEMIFDAGPSFDIPPAGAFVAAFVRSSWGLSLGTARVHRKPCSPQSIEGGKYGHIIIEGLIE
jgi:hypothetical protein